MNPLTGKFQLKKAGALALVSALTWMAAVRAVEATANRWSLSGPEGTAVTAFAIDPHDPSTLYAGTPVGVSKSTDGGRSWSHVFDSDHVNVLAIDPHNPATVYVGTGWLSSSSDRSGGLFKTIDGGRTWSSVSNGLFVYNGSPRIRDIMIAPQSPSTLYVTVLGGPPFKSTDAGHSWRSLDGLTGTYVTTMAVDSRTPGTVYAATQSSYLPHQGRLLKSHDGGVTWVTIYQGSPAESFTLLMVDPGNSTTLYAGHKGHNWGVVPAPLFKSVDGGASWTSIGEGVNGGAGHWSVADLRLDPSKSGTLVAAVASSDGAGFFRSTSGGEEWARISSGPSASTAVLAIDPVNSSTIYAGTLDDGLFKSADAGGSWNAANNGLPPRAMDCLRSDPISGALYAFVADKIYPYNEDNRLYKSTDKGARWHLVGSFPSCPAIAPTNPATMHVGGGTLVGRTTDEGRTWSWHDIGLPAGSCPLACGLSAFAIDPRVPTTLYVAVTTLVRDSPTRWVPVPLGIYRSTDGGDTWTLNGTLTGVSTRASEELTGDPRNSHISKSVIGSMIVDHSGVLYTANDFDIYGSSCQRSADWYWYSLPSLAVDSATPATLYATVPEGLYKCTRGDTKWTSVNTGLPAVDSHGNGFYYRVGVPVIEPNDPAILYMSTYDDGLFTSSDAGQSWRPFDPPLPQGLWGQVVLDPGDPATLHISTKAGIYIIKQRPKPGDTSDEAGQAPKRGTLAAPR